jgi:hypothetical protein
LSWTHDQPHLPQRSERERIKTRADYVRAFDDTKITPVKGMWSLFRSRHSKKILGVGTYSPRGRLIEESNRQSTLTGLISVETGVPRG